MADDEIEVIDTAAPETPPEVEEPPETPAEEVAAAGEDDDETPAKKDPVAQLKGRVGHLTKTLHEKDAEIARLRSTTPPGEAPTADAKEAVKAELRAEQAQAAFDEACNEVFDQGKAEFADDFQESIVLLNTTGILQRPMIEAAIATGDAAKVLHHLGQDLDAAERIAKMHPVKMAVEMTKLAVKLAGTKARQSNAPPPIKPLGGSAKPEIDISDPNLSDEEYYARRRKQGTAPWLQ